MTNEARISEAMPNEAQSITKLKMTRPLILSGLDIKKDGATVQIWADLGNFYGDDRSFERNIHFLACSKEANYEFAEEICEYSWR